MAERLELCAAYPDATVFSGAAGSDTTAKDLGLQHHWVPCPLVLLSLCVSVYPPLDVQMCGILQCPGVLSRGTFVELWMFHWLQIEGERQRECLILPWYWHYSLQISFNAFNLYKSNTEVVMRKWIFIACKLLHLEVRELNHLIHHMNGKSMYDNRTLNYNFISNRPGKPKHNLCRPQLRMVKTWSVTSSFSNFCLHRKPNIFPWSST